MSPSTFEQFESQSLAQGFDQVLPRVWAADTETGTHVHPFSVQAVVVEGEFWLTCGDETRHLRAGDSFSLDREVPHAERYGSAGATIWVARRHAPVPAA